MTQKALFRLAFSLCLLLVAVLGVSRSANACPRAVTIKYYGWVEVAYPNGYHWCNYPVLSPPPPPGSIVWQQIGQETTDCDGNYSSWGGPCQGLDPQPANAVETSTACTCHS